MHNNMKCYSKEKCSRAPTELVISLLIIISDNIEKFEELIL